VEKKYSKKQSNNRRVPAKGELSDNEEIRLNKFIASSGLCSRREADVLIANGKVKINGEVVSELGYKIKERDEVYVNNKKLTLRNFIYILINKPKDMLSTTKDDQGRRTVIDLISSATDERVFPVGRLDRNTTGLLLLTNDGDLAQYLTHPSQGVEKIYSATLDKPLTKADFDRIIANEVQLEDGFPDFVEIAYTKENNKEIGIKLVGGRNRIIRRTFEALDYNVEKLDRVSYGPLTKRLLPRGKFRFLSDKEVNILKRFVKKV
jgi:23S rRNA pseudouridine2605 synthase